MGGAVSDQDGAPRPRGRLRRRITLGARTVTVNRSVIDLQLSALLQKQLFNSSSALQRAVLLEGLARLVYEHVKFRTPDGARLDDPERNGVALVLAAAATNSRRLRQGATSTDS
jgi:hypothetical protein